MVLTLALVYLCGALITVPGTYVASRRLADRDLTPLSSLAFSLLAGLIWPLMIIGVVELSSVAMYSAARSIFRDPEIPESWFSGGGPTNVVVPLR